MTLTPECGNDAAAYVLGALDAHELVSFTRHLDSCSVCQAEVESFRQLVNILPESVPQYSAPKALRRKVMADVREDALGASHTAPARNQRFFAPATSGGSRWTPAWARTPIPRFHAGLVGAGVAFALVCAVVLVGLTASGTKAKSQIFYKASIGSGGLVVSGGHSQLIVHHLTQLPDTSTYEVWLQSAGGKPQPTSVLFNTNTNGDDAVRIPDSLAGVTKVLVTQEPAGGRVTPTTKPVVAAKIS